MPPPPSAQTAVVLLTLLIGPHVSITGQELNGAGSSRAAASAHGEDEASTASAIFEALRRDDFERARDLLTTWLDNHPDDPVMLYNAACVSARLDEPARSEQFLLDAVKAGFDNFSVMKRDPDLDSIRGRPMYRAIMAARDAADDVLAQRRIRTWQKRLEPFRYELASDEQGRIDWLNGLSRDRFRALRNRLAPIIRAYSEFFGDGLDHRALVVILDDRDRARFFPNQHVNGRYAHADRLLLADGSLRAVAHELFHAFHHAHMDRLGQEHPIWIQEGLASLFESMGPGSDGAMTIYANERDAIARAVIEGGDERPWRTLASMDRPTFDRNAAETYALSRTIFAFLAEQGVLDRWYARYTETFDDDPSGLAAIGDALGSAPNGIQLADVEAVWADWILTRRLNHPAGDRAGAAVASADFAEPTVDAALADDRPERARDLFEHAHPRRLDQYAQKLPQLREVIRLDPNHADARYDLGLASLLAGDLEAARRQHEHLLRLDRNLANLLGALLGSAEN